MVALRDNATGSATGSGKIYAKRKPRRNRPMALESLEVREVMTARPLLGPISAPSDSASPSGPAALVANENRTTAALVANENPNAATAVSMAAGPSIGRDVFGTDNRVLVTNTTATPWSRVVKLRVTWSNAQPTVASGAMIGPYHVLTAGHAIFNKDRGGWATGVTVIPGQNGAPIANQNVSTTTPFGQVNATYIRSVSGWTLNRDSQHDWGLITLSSRVGDKTGWFGYGYNNNDSFFVNATVNTAGYPDDRSQGQRMYRASGPISHVNANQVFYNGTMDTFGGQSGSAVWVYNGSTGQRIVYAIHTGGGAYNRATRITQARFNLIQSWIAEDNRLRPGRNAAAQLASAGAPGRGLESAVNANARPQATTVASTRATTTQPTTATPQRGPQIESRPTATLASTRSAAYFAAFDSVHNDVADELSSNLLTPLA